MGPVEIFVSAHPLWAWLAIAAVFLAVETVTGSGWMLWPAGAAALTGIASLLWPGLAGPGAFALFAAATILGAYLGRRLIRRRPSRGDDINDPQGRLVGHRGEAVADFEGGLGRVFVDGKEWSAECETNAALTKGARVEVTAVQGGARLTVRAS